MRGVAERDRAANRFGKYKPKREANVNRRRCAAVKATAHIVSQGRHSGVAGQLSNLLRGRKTARGQLGVDLSRQRVRSSSLEKSGRNKGRRAHPYARALRGTEKPLDPLIQRWGQRTQVVEIAASGDGELQFAYASFGPRASQGANGTLCRLAQPHRCVNDEVIEVPVAVEVHGQDVCVAMAMLQRRILLVPARQFRAMTRSPLATRPTMAR